MLLLLCHLTCRENHAEMFAQLRIINWKMKKRKEKLLHHYTISCIFWYTYTVLHRHLDWRNIQEVHTSNAAYLHVLYLTQVGIFGSKQQSPGLIQLCFHSQRLIIQQRELRLETLILWCFLHHLLWNVPKVHLTNRQTQVNMHIQTIGYIHITFLQNAVG